MRKNNLLAILTSSVILTGCSNFQKDIKIGDYTFEEKAYTYLEEIYSEKKRDFPSDERLLDYAENSDKNKDFYISEKEIKQAIKAVAASVRAIH